MKRYRGWKAIIVGTMAGLSIVGGVVSSDASEGSEEITVWMDNRGPGSLNSGPGSLHSGHQEGMQSGRGRNSGEETLLAQISDVRQEDRREDRRIDRREDRREDRQVERREDHRSNAGGELRGLDRADQVAGEHGREGRENARMMQMDRPHRPERMERPQRPDRPERIERPERQDRPERPDRPERGGRH